MFGVVAQQRGLGRRRLFSGRQTCFPWLGPAAKLRCQVGECEWVALVGLAN